MTVLADAYNKAQEIKANDITTYIWKGPKVNGVQEEVRLVDADFYQLQKYYNHCNEMLYNKDSKVPGRVVLRDIVQDQIQRCRAELLIRWLRSERHYTTSSCLEDLRTIISNNKEELTQEAIKTYPIGNLMNGVPLEFERVPVGLVLSACLDALGTFDNSHLTLNFIVKMGLWFTQQEMQKPVDEGGLYKKDPETGKAINRLEVASKVCGLNPSVVLKINNISGLTFAEFRAMCKLKRDKYTNLTSEQLRILSTKVLYRFQDQCEAQAKQWQNKIEEILKVAESKGWDVTRNIE